MFENIAKRAIRFGDKANHFTLSLFGRRYIWIDGAYIGWHKA